MLAAGAIGTALLGNIQDREINRELLATLPVLHEQLVGEEKTSVFGAYSAVDIKKLAMASAEAQATVKKIQEGAKRGALGTVAVFPGIMLLSYLGLLLYFRMKGGYRPVELAAQGVAVKAEPDS